jgi:hypothetical protein
LELTRISFEQSPVEQCITLPEEHLLIPREMMEGICFSHYCLKLTTVVRWSLSLLTVLAKEDVEVHLHASETKTEHFWLCVWLNCHLEKLSL